MEIVIHVNMLKEGWDVNNLYTIVPLRVAASVTLQEQTIGRGVRLPYGRRAGDDDVDSLWIAAHENFAECVEYARQHGVGVRTVEQDPDAPPEREVNVQTTLGLYDERQADAEAPPGIPPDLQREATALLRQRIDDAVQESGSVRDVGGLVTGIADEVHHVLAAEHDLAMEDDSELALQLADFVQARAERVYRGIAKGFIPIPRIETRQCRAANLEYGDFDLDFGAFNYAPVRERIQVQKLGENDVARFQEQDVPLLLVADAEEWLRAWLADQPAIDARKCGRLVSKLVRQFAGKYRGLYGGDGLLNIVSSRGNEIGQRIYEQIERHTKREEPLFSTEVVGATDRNLRPHLSAATMLDLQTGDFKGSGKHIKSVAFTGLTKSVFDPVKLDSLKGEVTFAQMLERDDTVLRWLRPAAAEFRMLRLPGGERYQPDFVVETKDCCWLVEVKAEGRMNDADTQAKRQVAEDYCRVASDWCAANGCKPWRYAVVPAGAVTATSTADFWLRGPGGRQ